MEIGEPSRVALFSAVNDKDSGVKILGGVGVASTSVSSVWVCADTFVPLEN